MARTAGEAQRRLIGTRVGNYRVVYNVYDSDDLILILQIARRSETTYRQVR